MNASQCIKYPLPLAAVALALKVEPQLEDAVAVLRAEAVPVRVLPGPVDHFKRNVLVRRARVEAQHREARVVLAARLEA